LENTKLISMRIEKEKKEEAQHNQNGVYCDPLFNNVNGNSRKNISFLEISFKLKIYVR